MDSTKREDFMMKRSVNKSRITAQNYKSRWFILDNDTLSYKDGTLEVVYGEGAEFFTLYIVALKDDQRKEWIEILRDAAGKKHACFFPKYHPGVWTKSLGRYSCCDQIDRNAVGCSLTTPEKDDATVPSVSKQQSVINKPLPPKPEDNNQSRDKKFYIAIYNFTPVEDGDLELQQKDRNGFVYNFIYEGNKVVITLYSSSATLHIQGKGCGNWFKEEFSVLGKQLHNEVTYFQTSLIENNTDQMSTGNLLLESMISFDTSVTDPKLLVTDMSNTLITSTPITT
ncbi:ITK [Mytilus edulis]|uniref:ITK n=1 Tax=Mytilus edulis TaxID=6550 RepID=A0A8S3UIP3_MYTED|nr:ITK [Mytilus edulis]